MVWEEHARALSMFGFAIAGVQFIILGLLIRLHFRDQAKMAAVSHSDELLTRHQSELQHMAPLSMLDADTDAEDANEQVDREKSYEETHLCDEALLDAEEERLHEETRYRRLREEESRLAKRVIAGFAPRKH